MTIQAVIRDKSEHQWLIANEAIPDYRAENSQYRNNWHKFRYYHREGDGKLVGSRRKNTISWFTIHERVADSALRAHKEDDEWGQKSYVVCLFDSLQDISNRVMDSKNPLFQEEFSDLCKAQDFINSLFSEEDRIG